MEKSENIKLGGLLFFIGNLLGLWGIVVLGVFYFYKKEQLTEYEKSAFIEMFNFAISIIIYYVIGIVLNYIFIGTIILIFVSVYGIIVSIMGLLKHISGEKYEYPYTLKIIKNL